jgi:mono/diheme cytochrome c family protein
MGRLIDATHRNLARLVVGAGFVLAASSALAADADLNSIRGVPLPGDLNRMNGAQLYDAYCASCHHAQGQRSGGPPFRSAALGDAKNLVMLILQGRQRQTDVRMPGFANELSDRQIATLSNYLTQRWGNPKATVSVKQVKALRRGAPGSGAR